MRMRGGSAQLFRCAKPEQRRRQLKENIILWNLSSAVCFSYITEPVTKFINFCTLQMKICFIE